MNGGSGGGTVIRPVRATDQGEWARMRSALWPESPDGHAAEIGEFFSGDSMDIVEALVVERPDGGLEGFVEINLRNFAEGSREREVPYIEAWYVDPDARGHGIGKALMRHAEAWSTRRGYRELASDTELGNQNGIAAHEALDFRETCRIVCFLKKLA